MVNKTYVVHLGVAASIRVVVEASSEMEAIDKARELANTDDVEFCDWSDCDEVSELSEPEKVKN